MGKNKHKKTEPVPTGTGAGAGAAGAAGDQKREVKKVLVGQAKLQPIAVKGPTMAWDGSGFSVASARGAGGHTTISDVKMLMKEHVEACCIAGTQINWDLVGRFYNSIAKLDNSEVKDPGRPAMFTRNLWNAYCNAQDDSDEDSIPWVLALGPLLRLFDPEKLAKGGGADSGRGSDGEGFYGRCRGLMTDPDNDNVEVIEQDLAQPGEVVDGVVMYVKKRMNVLEIGDEDWSHDANSLAGAYSALINGMSPVAAVERSTTKSTIFGLTYDVDATKARVHSGALVYYTILAYTKAVACPCLILEGGKAVLGNRRAIASERVPAESPDYTYSAAAGVAMAIHNMSGAEAKGYSRIPMPRALVPFLQTAMRKHRLTGLEAKLRHGKAFKLPPAPTGPDASPGTAFWTAVLPHIMAD